MMVSNEEKFNPAWVFGQELKANPNPRLRLFLRNRGIRGIRGKRFLFRIFRVFRGSLLILDWHEMWRGPILLVLGALAHP
jgi:hypothetical protein